MPIKSWFKGLILKFETDADAKRYAAEHPDKRFLYVTER